MMLSVKLYKLFGDSKTFAETLSVVLNPFFDVPTSESVEVGTVNHEVEKKALSQKNEQNCESAIEKGE